MNGTNRYINSGATPEQWVKADSGKPYYMWYRHQVAKFLIQQSDAIVDRMLQSRLQLRGN